MVVVASALLTGTWIMLLPLLAMSEAEGSVTIRLLRMELMLREVAGGLFLQDNAEVSRSTDDLPKRFLLICVSR